MTNQERAFKLLERLGQLPATSKDPMQADILAMLEAIVERLERIEQDRRRSA